MFCFSGLFGQGRVFNKYGNNSNSVIMIDNISSQTQTNIADITELLESEEFRVRAKGLKLAKELCISLENIDETAKFYEKLYLHILKCYSDQYGVCRELAIGVISEFLGKLPQTIYYAEYIVQTIAERMGKENILEPEEEIRLLLVNQIIDVIEKFGESSNEQDPLLKSFDSVASVLKNGLRDQCPDVLKASCKGVQVLAGKSKSFHLGAEGFINPLARNLAYKHFTTRVAVIEALTVVALNIFSNNDAIVRILGDLSPRLMDSVPHVRRAVGRAACKFLMEMRDRYSNMQRILPVILGCLCDESPEVQEEVRALWIKCGEQYYAENEAELSKKELVDDKPKNYPNVQRPTLACRAIVQRCLQIVKVIARETTDIADGVPLHAFNLLWMFVLHAEDTLTPHFSEVFHYVCAGTRNDDPAVAKKAADVASLLGQLIKYDDWIASGIEELRNSPRLSSLKGFYYVYKGSDTYARDDALELTEIMIQPEFCHELKGEFQKYLVLLAIYIAENHRSRSQSLDERLQDLNLTEVDAIERNLYTVAIKVHALNADNVTAALTFKLLKKLTPNHSEQEIYMLHNAHLGYVLKTLTDLTYGGDEQSVPIVLLFGIISLCKFRTSYFEEMKLCIETVLDHGSNKAKLKVLSGVGIALLSWKDTMDVNKEESVRLLTSLLKGVLTEHLQWKPGATAEYLRAMAASILCSLSESIPEEAQVILPAYAAMIPSLLEDNTVSIRLYALRCLANIGEITLEELKNICYGVLSRLDDPQVNIRRTAGQIISKLITSTQKDKSLLNELVKNILNTLLLYCEDPDPVVRDIAKESIFAIAERYPTLVKEFCISVKQILADKKDAEELCKKLNEAIQQE